MLLGQVNKYNQNIKTTWNSTEQEGDKVNKYLLLVATIHNKENPTLETKEDQ